MLPVFRRNTGASKHAADDAVASEVAGRNARVQPCIVPLWPIFGPETIRQTEREGVDKLSIRDGEPWRVTLQWQKLVAMIGGGPLAKFLQRAAPNRCPEKQGFSRSDDGRQSDEKKPERILAPASKVQGI